MAEHLEVNPAPFLIGLAASTNLQGSATLIGDAPSMILAGYADMSFNDFFWMQGRSGLFFAVQVGAAAAAIGLLWFCGKKIRAVGASAAFAHARRRAARFEWGTVFLLMGLFVVVGTLSEVGLIEAIAGAIRSTTGGNLLLFGLLIGATVGGNVTPIGASANVVAVRMLEKKGHHVEFGRFMRIGVPFTLVAVAASILFLWVFWKLLP